MIIVCRPGPMLGPSRVSIPPVAPPACALLAQRSTVLSQLVLNSYDPGAVIVKQGKQVGDSSVSHAQHFVAALLPPPSLIRLLSPTICGIGVSVE